MQQPGNNFQINPIGVGHNVQATPIGIGASNNINNTPAFGGANNFNNQPIGGGAGFNQNQFNQIGGGYGNQNAQINPVGVGANNYGAPSQFAQNDFNRQPMMQPIGVQNTQNQFNNQIPQNNFGGSFGSGSPLLTNFLNTVTIYMNQNHGLSFEGLLQRFGLRPYDPYLDIMTFKDFCKSLNFNIDFQEARNLATEIDPYGQGKIQTSALRNKIESHQPQFNRNMMPNQNNFGQPQMNQNDIHPMLRNQQQPNLQINLPQQNQFQQPQINQFNHYPYQQNQFGQGPQGQFGLLSPTSQMLLPIFDKIRAYLQKLNFTNIRQAFDVYYLQQKEVIELQQFLNFLQIPDLNITQMQAYQMADEFNFILSARVGAYQTKQFIDLQKFEEKIFAGAQGLGGLIQQPKNYYVTIEKVYDSIRQYIVNTGGNIMKFFTEMDTDKDNFVSKSELKMCLHKIGLQVSDDDVNSIFMTLDQNKDGRVSYAELCKNFAEFSNGKAIKDPNHWSFYIFENIRRACQVNQKPLSVLFGLNVQIKSLKDKIPIPKDQFFQALNRLRIPLNYDLEKKLLELLDADSHQQWQIDFIHFSELVGLHYQPGIQFQQIANDYIKNPLGQQQHSQMKRFYRSLFDVLQSRNITTKNLQMVFRASDPGNSGFIQLNDFISKMKEFDVMKKIDDSLLRDGAQKFMQQNGFAQMFNYSDFLGKVTFEFEKFKTIDFIFLTFEAAFKQLNVNNLNDLFMKFDNTGGMRQFDKTMLQSVLYALGINLNAYELDMVLIEYDPEGKGARLDFNLFDSDFREFQSGNSQLNSYILKKNVQYNDYQSYKQQNPNNRQPAIDRPINQRNQGNLSGIMSKIGRYLDANKHIQITQILLQFDVSKSGILTDSSFQTMLERVFQLNADESSSLLFHYDPQTRRQVKVGDFINDLKNHVQDLNVKMQLTSIAQEFGISQVPNNQAGINREEVLQRYAADFSEIQKAIVVRKSDTYKWFQGYAQQGSSKLSRENFRQAISSLNPSYLKLQDIDRIFDALDSTFSEYKDIYLIDETIRRYSSTGQQMTEDIVEKIVKAFNADEGFLLKELGAIDKTGRGLLDVHSFVQFFMRNSPQHIQFGQPDLILLANRFTNPTDPNIVDVNKFLSEFSYVRKNKNIPVGYYQGMHDLNQGGFPQGGKQLHQPNNFGSGHRNPLLPQYTNNNTRAELNRLSAPMGFAITLDPLYLEDIARATYVREKLVQDYFQEFGQMQNRGILQESEFGRAIQILGLKWNLTTVSTVFNQIDLAMHNYQRKMTLLPEEIDQAVAFGAKQNINLRTEIQNYDFNYSKQISVDNMKELLLNKLRVPQISDFDVIFLSKKYIQNMPNQIMYGKLLEDLDGFQQNQFQNVSSSKNILEYIKKATLTLQRSEEDYFSQFCQLGNIMTLQEFEKACTQLGIVPDICQLNELQTVFKEMDLNGQYKVTIQQLKTQILKYVHKSTKEMQDELIEDIIAKSQGKALVIDNIFKQDDPNFRGQVTLQAFALVLQRTLGVREIDAKLVALRYQDGAFNVNYPQFLKDYHQNENNVRNRNQFQGGKPMPGLGFGQPSNSQQARLRQLLIQINDYCQKSGISLHSYLSQYEKSSASGSVPQTLFIQTLDFAKIPLPNDDKYYISENYIIPNTQPPLVNYLQFLEDIKLYTAAPPKTLLSLTENQKKLYTNLNAHLKSKNKVGPFTEAFLSNDFNSKGYLSRINIENIFRNQGYQFSKKQFDTLFSTLDTNHAGEFNYKQIFDLTFGEGDSQKLLITGGKLGTTGGVRQQTVTFNTFVMPNQPIGAANAIMSQIGKKMILSNQNYEEEFRRRIGTTQATAQIPKATDADILSVLTSCKVSLGQDERNELELFFRNKKDTYNLISVIDFLQAVGLPAQTLGSRGMKNLPRKILNAQELKLCQDIINKIRNQIQRLSRKPQDIFERQKQQATDLTIPMLRFKLALADLGPVGQQISEEQYTLLSYYLTQEVPNEVSLKKLYFALTLTDTDPPLKQEGSEEIRQYEKTLKERMEQGVPLEIIDFQHFMRQSGLSFAQVFKNTQKGLIGLTEFETALRDAGFIPKDIQKLIEKLDIKKTRQSVSLDKLQEYLRKASPDGLGRTITPQMARERFTGFDPKVRRHLQRISDFMKRENITLAKMHEDMDVNRDGLVDKMEFVNRLSMMQIRDLNPSDLGMIFDAIDINNDGVLSVNEFGMFIEGAKTSRMQRQQELDPKLIEEMKREIMTLFTQFDDNNDGFVTADEIVKSMMALGQRITLDEAKNMIAQIDSNSDGKLDQREFIELMLPKMKDELLNQEDSLEDLRAMFLDADIDHSGTLSVDEIYSVMLKLGAEVQMDELVELMNEIDVDRNGSLDIDEFIALMSMGDEIQFKSATSQNTLLNIKRARKLNPLDFFKQFKNMPSSFVPSLFTEKWSKFKQNLPSSVFVPQIDPKTMLYKDLFPLLPENINPQQAQRSFQPRLRPILTELGCQILLEECQGVPIPEGGKGGFDRSQIVKRMVRIGLYDLAKKDFIFNAVQVNGIYNQVDEDMWQFNAWRDNGTNPVIFRAANKDELVKPNIFIIFELVIAVKIGEKITEMSCGWCQLDMALLDRQMTHKLPIKGGSPNAEMMIKDQDVHTNRTGLKYLMKVVQTKINSQLTVSIRPHTKFTEETKFHLDLLPSTCFIQKRLLYFVSGFRNYIGEKLLKESGLSHFMQPEGDVIISTFPKILDNPDICEQIINIWAEDVWSQLNSRQKLNVELIMIKTKEFIQKLYPVIYAEEFKYKESDYTFSAAGNPYLLRKREELIKSALRFGNPGAKVKADKPIELLSTFKPFTVRELEFEVWNTQSAKQDRYLKQYEELGLLNPTGSQPNSIRQPLDNNSFAMNNSVIGGNQPRNLLNALDQRFGQ